MKPSEGLLQLLTIGLCVLTIACINTSNNAKENQSILKKEVSDDE